MKIRVEGPDNERQMVADPNSPKGWRIHEDIFESDKATVLEIVQEYCQHFGSFIEPYTLEEKEFTIEDKFFIYHFANGKTTMVDIHVNNPKRGFICLKQDLNHKVQEGDVVVLGTPAC